jgi:hypothetical protein
MLWLKKKILDLKQIENTIPEVEHSDDLIIFEESNDYKLNYPELEKRQDGFFNFLKEEVVQFDRPFNNGIFNEIYSKGEELNEFLLIIQSGQTCSKGKYVA